MRRCQQAFHSHCCHRRVTFRIFTPAPFMRARCGSQEAAIGTPHSTTQRAFNSGASSAQRMPVSSHVSNEDATERAPGAGSAGVPLTLDASDLGLLSSTERDAAFDAAVVMIPTDVSGAQSTGVAVAAPAVHTAYSEMVHAGFLDLSRRYRTLAGPHCPCALCCARVAAEQPSSESAVCLSPTPHEEIVEVLADAPAPIDSELCSIEFDATVACSTATEVAAPLCQSGADDVITEIHSVAPRGRGVSIKRRKRSRRPGDQRGKSE